MTARPPAPGRSGRRRISLRWPGGFLRASVLLQVGSLVTLSLLAAQAISLAIIFNLPPPPPKLFQLTEIISALQGGEVASREGVALARYRADRSPETFFVGHFARIAALDIGRRFNLTPAAVVVAAEPMRWGMSRAPRHLPPPPRDGPNSRVEDHFLMAPFKVAIRQGDGRWLVVATREAFPSAWHLRILLSFVLSAAALAPVAYLFARRLAAPISAFAAAAERLGRDPGAPPLRLDGPVEVDQAVAAFNGMQERLRRYVFDRTAMVGAVAHDLRTPLTRLRFRIEAAPPDLRARMVADIDQMDAMISATLGFVRDATQAADRHKLELVSLVESVADEMAETGLDVRAEEASPVVIEADPIGLRRLVTNLLDNAVKFGGAARARVYADGDSAVIEVDDDGPGVGENEREQLFEPFHRGEPSRSRGTGGAGLGLAVVRSVARAHGGDAMLINRAGGGLRALARLPI